MTIILAIIFVLGYLAIAFEHSLKINKAASALLTGVICWSIYALWGVEKELVSEELAHHLSEIAGILFFLLGAMVIVELIDAHDGFEIITDRIKTTSKSKLVWIVGMLAFFLSAVLDNLTTTIVMVSLLRKFIPAHKDRLMFAGLIVISANAGGAWSPIGDVTTTMLWIGNQITTANIIIKTILPSLVCFFIPALFISMQMKGRLEPMPEKKEKLFSTLNERRAVFIIGVACLLFVPVFKTITHLPPYMGIVFGLGTMWVLTEMVHSGKDEREKGLLSVNHALRKIDTPSILFFLGILLAVSALQSTGILTSVSAYLDKSVGNISIITIIIGFLSAIVDNVPLVAAAQGMYSLERYPTDHFFWEFLAYCSGTGGSILIIGSAAGVAAMGMERIPFGWYLKKIAWLATIGYLAGAAVFLLQDYFLHL
ncbi:MAG TPA: sodium:proton antiporter NhaD [Chitinophagaceae bacterium]|jgi:Na+/H+ antiporter NhaD/arsenite permease-like protein|nr:sodium:proton antiporter NhaD [Chitinophagaceae bacterium]